MKNLETLSNKELRSINGGCQFGDCGQGPIIVVGPTSPDRPPFGDPREWDNYFPN